jgi:hypothetical protein
LIEVRTLRFHGSQYLAAVTAAQFELQAVLDAAMRGPDRGDSIRKIAVSLERAMVSSFR